MPKVSQNELISGAIAGKVVSFPTDTVPALAVLPQNAALIFALKQRPQNKPLILMGSSETDLWSYVTGTPAELKIWQQVTRQYWPGQLTLVLPAAATLPQAIDPTDSATIGMRIPNCEIALEILARTGALATTSANLSGEPPLETLEAIARAFPDVLVLDDTAIKTDTKRGSGLPSTVAKWTGKDWTILRRGSIREL